MQLKEAISLYQQLLVDEYRTHHPEETAGLSDEEVALMNPITEEDIMGIKMCQIAAMRNEIIALQAEIDDDKEALLDPSLWREVAAEIRADIRHTQLELRELENRISEIEKTLPKEDNNERTSRRI